LNFIIKVTLSVGLFISSANAIVIRHDVDDVKYRQLGEKYSLSVAYVGGCAATLIDSTWLLMAAHCVQGREDSFFTSRHHGSKYRIEKIFVHPHFDRKNDEDHDMALVQLKDPITTGKPATLYSANDEKGKAVVFVGRGTYGNGRDGLLKDDGIQRGATNTIISVSEKVIGFQFNSPKDATIMEGISSRGDSGGPAFISLGSELYVAGVSSYQDKVGLKEGTYGVMEYYTRVSTHLNWLSTTIGNTPAANIPEHPIIEAVKNNNLPKVKQLIDKKLLNSDEILNEVFYQSVVHNQIDIMEELISRGVVIERITLNHSSLFEFALSYNRKEYFEKLLELTGAENNIHKKDSAVLPLLISRYKHDDTLLNYVKHILKQGANVNAQTSSGDTALIISGWATKNLTLVRYLVENGADLNIGNNNGDTPLMDAAYLGKTSILGYLLQSGADTTLTNKKGKSASGLAKNKEITQLLASYIEKVTSD
jgi:ankyrin repeat protein